MFMIVGLINIVTSHANPDVAGLVADTTIRNEPWFSPAGFNRGGIRNLAKLAWTPGKSDRDELYSNRINPIAIFPVRCSSLWR